VQQVEAHQAHPPDHSRASGGLPDAAGGAVRVIPYPSLHLNLGEALSQAERPRPRPSAPGPGPGRRSIGGRRLRQDDLIDHRRSGTTRRPPADAVIRFLAGWMTSQPIGEVSAGLAGTGWST
jgi:hypothetical protein